MAEINKVGRVKHVKQKLVRNYPCIHLSQLPWHLPNQALGTDQANKGTAHTAQDTVPALRLKI